MKKRNSALPDYERILQEMADIAFSKDEKTTDRLRALDLLCDAIRSGAPEEEALQKLDVILQHLTP